jgi:hypothetical protein
MKPSEMDAIYTEACRAASNRPVPEPAQLKIWKQVMGGFDAKDIRGGLEIWWKTQIFLPMPSELKPLAEQARRESIAKTSNRTDHAAWECPVCGNTIGGFVTTDDHAPRVCHSPYSPRGVKPRSLPAGVVCGSIMEEVSREDTRQWKDQR